MKYRRGDKVSVLGIVKHDERDGEKVFIDVIGSHETLWLDSKDFSLVTPMFEVGDRCSWYGLGGTEEVNFTGIVLAISDGHAWIDRGGGDYCTRLLTTIERVDSDD